MDWYERLLGEGPPLARIAIAATIGAMVGVVCGALRDDGIPYGEWAAIGLAVAGICCAGLEIGRGV